MSLPKNDFITYTLQLPVSKKEIRFRPFLVKEQRNLMVAMESDDDETIERNIKQVLTNCTLTDIDIDKLPMADVEFYFINLRARSVNEIVENLYQCKNQNLPEEKLKATDSEGNKICGGIMKVEFNLLEVKVDINENIKDIIKLTDTLSMKLRSPDFAVVQRASKYTNDTDKAFDMIVDCIEYIAEGEEIHYAKEHTPKELMEFIETLNQNQFEKVEEFFMNLPKVSKKLTMQCGKCGLDHAIEVEGLENFFG